MADQNPSPAPQPNQAEPISATPTLNGARAARVTAPPAANSKLEDAILALQSARNDADRAKAAQRVVDLTVGTPVPAAPPAAPKAPYKASMTDSIIVTPVPPAPSPAAETARIREILAKTEVPPAAPTVAPKVEVSEVPSVKGAPTPTNPLPPPSPEFQAAQAAIRQAQARVRTAEALILEETKAKEALAKTNVDTPERADATRQLAEVQRKFADFGTVEQAKEALYDAQNRAAGLSANARPAPAPATAAANATNTPTPPAPKPAAAVPPQAPRNIISNSLSKIDGSKVGAVTVNVAIPALSAVLTSMEVNKGIAQIDNGDRNGGARTVGAATASYVAALASMRTMALNSGRSLMGTGTPPLMLAGELLIGAGLTLSAGMAGAEIGGLIERQIPTAESMNTPEARARSIPAVSAALSAPPKAAPSASTSAPTKTPLGDALAKHVLNSEDVARVQALIDNTEPGANLAKKRGALSTQLAQFKKITGNPGEEIRKQEQLLKQAVAVLTEAEQVTKARAAAIAPPVPVAAAPVAAARTTPSTQPIIYTAKEGENLSSIADARSEAMSAQRRIMKEALKNVLPEGVKPSNGAITRALATALATESGIESVDTIVANQALKAVSDATAKDVAKQLLTCGILDATTGNIPPRFKPRDISQIMNCPAK